LRKTLTTLLRGKTNNLGLVELKSGGVGGEAIANLSKTGGIKVAITGDGKGATQGKITYNNTKNTKIPKKKPILSLKKNLL